MEEVMKHVVGAGSVEGNVELLVPGLNESKCRIGLNVEDATQVVSEKSGLVGTSDKLPSDFKTNEEFVNTEAQLLHGELGEGIARDSELSLGLESATTAANVESDSEDEISSMPASSLAGSDEVMITEIATAVEEMRTVGAGAFLLSESHTIPDYLTINPSDIKAVRKIGKGGSGIVYEATLIGTPCAVKRLKKEYSTELVSLIKQELDILIKLRHPHIVMLMGCSFDSKHRCSIVMEKMAGSLRSLIESRKQERKQSQVPFDFSEALDIMKQIALGLEYLHSNGVSHRDLKSDNVLFQDLGDGKWEVKIVDFGASLNIDSSTVHLGVGTGFWRAPEVLRRGITESSSKFDLKAADVYSLAMTFYEVLTGKVPFEGKLKANEWEKVRNGLIKPELPINLDGRLTKLLNACWSHKPEDRPNIKNIREELCSGVAVIESSGSGSFPQVAKALEIVQGVWLNAKHLFNRVAGRGGCVQTSAWSGNAKNESGREKGASGSEEGASTDVSTIPKNLKIEFKSLEIKGIIGEGASTVVYEVTWLGLRFAMKTFRYYPAVENELDFLIQLRHPYIIQIVGFSVDKQGLGMFVMDYMDGSLRHLMDSRINKKAEVTMTNPSKVLPFEFHEVVGIIRKIALGMAFLHSKGVVHRDIKSLNVLCREHADFIDVKIEDFGVSEYINAAQDGRLGTGTGFWRAPEILPTKTNQSREGGVDLKAADVYSFAMTCYEILTGREPFSEYGIGPIDYDLVVEGLRPTLPSDMGLVLKMLIEDCWHGNPDRRPNFGEICYILSEM